MLERLRFTLVLGILTANNPSETQLDYDTFACAKLRRVRAAVKYVALRLVPYA